jgi:hypothetical protein
MSNDLEPIPLLPPMTPEQIEAFLRSFRNKPLTPEEIEFFKNPRELVPMRQVIADLEEIARQKKAAGDSQ